MEYAYPFDSVVTEGTGGVPEFDRAVSSAGLRNIYASLFSNGVLLADDSGRMQVSAGTGMQVVVAKGSVIVSGALKVFDAATPLAISAANSTNPRIDAIVVEFNASQAVRDITLKVVSGTASASPQVPTLTRTSEIYQLALAHVRVNAGMTSVTSANITDRRSNATYCGFCKLKTADNFINEQLTTLENNIASVRAEQESAFSTWFANIQETLSNVDVGALTNRIIALENTTDNLELNTLKAAYPVGAIYMSMDDTSPATIFGFGTWARINGRFLLSSGQWRSGSTNFEAGQRGGEEAHTLTVDELPAHSHTMKMNVVSYQAGAASSAHFGNGGASSGHGNYDGIINNAGGGQPHNNMPPYFVVNMWRRTA